MVQDHIKREYAIRAIRGEGTRELYETFPKGHYADFASFKRALMKWKAKVKLDGDMLEGANLEYKFKPYASSVQVNADGKVISAWIKQSAADQAQAWEDFVDKVMKKPCRTILPARPRPKASRSMLEIPLFDMHFGIADMAYYEETLLRVLAHIKEDRYDTVVIAIGQDLLHNDDFRGRTSKGTPIERVDLEKAWADAETFFVNVIASAQEHADHVKVLYSHGNHDESMSWAFVKLLERIFPEVSFDTEKKPRKAVHWDGCLIGFTHAEYARSRPEDLFAQFAVEFPAAFAASTVREVHSGHLHSERGWDVGVMVRRLPTGSKTDEWSKDQGFVGAHKRFMLFRWEPGRLDSIYYV
jgi:hypothetical protein